MEHSFIYSRVPPVEVRPLFLTSLKEYARENSSDIVFEVEFSLACGICLFGGSRFIFIPFLLPNREQDGKLAEKFTRGREKLDEMRRSLASSE